MTRPIRGCDAAFLLICELKANEAHPPAFYNQVEVMNLARRMCRGSIAEHAPERVLIRAAFVALLVHLATGVDSGTCAGDDCSGVASDAVPCRIGVKVYVYDLPVIFNKAAEEMLSFYPKSSGQYETGPGHTDTIEDWRNTMLDFTQARDSACLPRRRLTRRRTDTTFWRPTPHSQPVAKPAQEIYLHRNLIAAREQGECFITTVPEKADFFFLPVYR